MDFLQYIPVLELLFFNLLTIDRCCHKKYSAKVTALVLFLFSAALPCQDRIRPAFQSLGIPRILFS